jgi:hypothetical protein
MASRMRRNSCPLAAGEPFHASGQPENANGRHGEDMSDSEVIAKCEG